MPIPDITRVRTKADVMALPINAETKSVLQWVLSQPPRVFERQDIAEALGMKPARVETAVMRCQRRPPHLFAQQGPEGERIGARHAYIPADSPLRAAWNNELDAQFPTHGDLSLAPTAFVDIDGDGLPDDVRAYNHTRARVLHDELGKISPARRDDPEAVSRAERAASIAAKKAAADVRAGRAPPPGKAPVPVVRAPSEGDDLAELLRGYAEPDETPTDVLLRVLGSLDEASDRVQELEAKYADLEHPDHAPSLEHAAIVAARAIFAAIERGETMVPTRFEAMLADERGRNTQSAPPAPVVSRFQATEDIVEEANAAGAPPDKPRATTGRFTKKDTK